MLFEFLLEAWKPLRSKRTHFFTLTFGNNATLRCYEHGIWGRNHINRIGWVSFIICLWIDLPSAFTTSPSRIECVLTQYPYEECYNERTMGVIKEKTLLLTGRTFARPSTHLVNTFSSREQFGRSISMNVGKYRWNGGRWWISIEGHLK